MPAPDRYSGEPDEFEPRSSPRDQHRHPEEGTSDPYRHVRRRLNDRARRGEDPFAGWQGSDDRESDKAWWELPEEPPMLPDAPNWQPGTIVGHLVPASRRPTALAQSPWSTPSRDRAAASFRDPLEQLSFPGLRDPFDDDEAFSWDTPARFDDWDDEPQRHAKRSKKPGKRSRRDDPGGHRRW